ncbi:hypothetical protein BDB00DRAFT_875729 [Zychaea mexicana]|uniref:uncharacterized protein n=1 Tax=Zychaea mexicana TaxID=64656 RepID=UPI0022FEB614|nr:uncharacterized protein BDB00DRAFT_875729 [Zychaea mexicana]KAI9490029.1 hypothetical protein BDB00DRAFT_875729 [Zychaea mexicana]
MPTEFDDKLESYLDACKCSMHYAKLSKFIDSHTPLIYEYKPDVVNPEDLKSSFKQAFNSAAKAIAWVKMSTEKAKHWSTIHSSSNASSEAVVVDTELCNVPTIIDTSLLDPLKEYIKDKKKGLNPAIPNIRDIHTVDGYQQYLFKYCLEFIKQDRLLKTVNGPLQLGLSGIINTVSTDKTIPIEDYLDKNRFEHLANILKKDEMSKKCMDDPIATTTKYEGGRIVGARVYILKKKLEMLEDGDGKVVSEATRSEMIDALGTVSSGRKIDMFQITQSEDGEESCVELAANEHKKGNAEFDIVIEQQAKNIVTNVCIMSQLRKRFGVDIGARSNTNPLIMDVIIMDGGKKCLRAYLYSVAKTQDVFVASKVSNNYVVLPTTLAELDEFIIQGSIYLLLNYSKYSITAANEIVASTDKITKRRFEAIMNDQVDADSPKIFFSENKKPKAS